MSSSKSVQSPAKASKAKRAARRTTAAGTTMLLQTATTSNAGAFAVAIAPETLKTLSTRKSNVKALVETFGKSVERSRKTGRASGFTVEVDAKGNPRISPVTVAKTGDEATARHDLLEKALSAARERGRLRAAEIIGGDDMLSAEAFAERLGVSRVTVNARRQKHELLALDGAKRGFRFPNWQVDEDGKPFEALPKLFDLLGESPWTVYRFLIQRHAALNGATAKDALRRGRTEDVLAAAESVAQGAFT